MQLAIFGTPIKGSAMSDTTKVVKEKAKLDVSEETLLKAWELMCTAKSMSELYNEKIQLPQNMCMPPVAGMKPRN